MTSPSSPDLRNALTGPLPDVDARNAMAAVFEPQATDHVGITVLKCCKDCGIERPLSDYYKNKNYGDGLFRVCKTCWCAHTRKYRAGNDEVRARDRARRQQPERKARLREAWAEKHDKAKIAVNALARSAIKRGDLVKQPCEVCGALKVHAHHDDYSKPLDVRWLCPMHHSQHHARVQEKWTIVDGQWVCLPHQRFIDAKGAMADRMLIKTATGYSDRRVSP